MGRNVIETLMGAVVLIVAAGFLVFAYQSSNVKTVEGYSLKALFSDASGILPGSEIRIGGVKVGAVEAMDINPKTYQAIVTLQIKDDIKLPKDSSAAIASAGLLGDKFIRLEPGSEEDMLKPGGQVRYTQSSISFEDLLGKFVFSGGGVEKGGGKTPAETGIVGGSAQPAPAPAPAPAKDNPFSLGIE